MTALPPRLAAVVAAQSTDPTDLTVRLVHLTDERWIVVVDVAPESTPATVQMLAAMPLEARVVGNGDLLRPEYMRFGTAGFGLGVVLYRIEWDTLSPLQTVNLVRFA